MTLGYTKLIQATVYISFLKLFYLIFDDRQGLF